MRAGSGSPHTASPSPRLRLCAHAPIQLRSMTCSLASDRRQSEDSLQPFPSPSSQTVQQRGAVTGPGHWGHWGLTMHQLFSLVLGQRDLSRAGDLFSLDDVDIEDCLSQALEQIKAISCSSDYLSSDNDQAVVEICITRITTAIRETGSIERHSPALVALWEACLQHKLTPAGESTEDTPHAKIASDITSCILQNYSCPSVMALAVPVAVRFLHRGNKELRRNMSSYLSLAAIAKAELLSEHAEALCRSVLSGTP
uniref:Uncharacterized protein n=2 Tax=Knipowitschia caucasica TaxID=637954 RepID=A0AAV2J4Q3_KNICA